MVLNRLHSAQRRGPAVLVGLTLGGGLAALYFFAGDEKTIERTPSEDLACIEELETEIERIASETGSCDTLHDLMASGHARNASPGGFKLYDPHPMEAECIGLFSAWRGPGRPGKSWEELFDDCSFSVCTVLLAREAINRVIRHPGDCAAALDRAREYFRVPD